MLSLDLDRARVAVVLAATTDLAVGLHHVANVGTDPWTFRLLAHAASRVVVRLTDRHALIMVCKPAFLVG